MGTSNQNDVDMSWIPQETLNQISEYFAFHKLELNKLNQLLVTEQVDDFFWTAYISSRE